jgi:hypothetical protein
LGVQLFEEVKVCVQWVVVPNIFITPSPEAALLPVWEAAFHSAALQGV